MQLNHLNHKFKAKPTDYKNVRYDSKLEASYAQKLDVAVKAGALLFYLRQVPFALPGKTKYVVDFAEFWAPVGGEPGEVIFTDVKGVETENFKLKLRQVEELYPVKINIVKKV